MSNVAEPALNHPTETPVVKSTTNSRKLSFVLQIAAMSGLFVVGLSGFVWWYTGSVELVWPWLRGDRLVFAPTRIDFGQVPKAQILEKTIRVTNLSSRSLTLLGSQPSCGCISLDEFPIVVQTGKTHVLRLKIGTSDQSGPFEHFIKFFSDEPNHSLTVLSVTGLVP